MKSKMHMQKSGLQIAEYFIPGEDHKIRLASQVGITHAIVNVRPQVERMGEKPGCVLGDGSYVSRENVEAMAEKGVELIAPVQEETAREAGALAANGIDPEFGRSLFMWDAQRKVFVCPAGQVLEQVKVRKHHGRACEVYSARAEQCACCHQALRCCGHLKPGTPRQIERVQESPTMRAFVERVERPENQQLYKKRSAVAETPHMRWKANWHWRRFSVRGLQKATMEASVSPGAICALAAAP